MSGTKKSASPVAQALYDRSKPTTRATGAALAVPDPAPAPPPATIFGREPVAIQAVLQAALALGIGFGLQLSAAQIGLILAFSAAMLGLITRMQVTPVEAPNRPLAAGPLPPKGGEAGH